MATKTPNVDEVLGKAHEMARKTRELLKEAEVLHASADAAHRKAEALHGRIKESREARATETNVTQTRPDTSG